MNLTYATIARRIDHALLLPTMTEAELADGCELAARYEVASVCIKPFAVPLAVRLLQGGPVRVGTVIGFPHGGQTTATKLGETREAFDLGATEVDMVVNIGAVRGGRWDEVEAEVDHLGRLTHERGGLLKVIFECCYLDDAQKVTLCEICGRVGVDYVKTSTGFGTGGATVADLTLMKAHIPSAVKLKASGGIRDLATAIRFVELGAERLGLSQTAQILDELGEHLGLPGRGGPRVSGRGAGGPRVDY